jgi:hypothetical protein
MPCAFYARRVIYERPSAFQCRRSRKTFLKVKKLPLLFCRFPENPIAFVRDMHLSGRLFQPPFPASVFPFEKKDGSNHTAPQNHYIFAV